MAYKGQPLYVVTRSYVAVSHRIIDEPWWDDDRLVARWMRERFQEIAAKRRRTRGYVRPADRESVCAAYGHRCVYCGASGLPLEMDHRVAVTRGGADALDNLVPACKPCNVRKSNQSPDDWPIIVERMA